MAVRVKPAWIYRKIDKKREIIEEIIIKKSQTNIIANAQACGGHKMKSLKREKFVRLAESRTKNAIKAIRVVAKLGNKSAYEYDESDVKKIASALTKEIDLLRSRMSSSPSKDAVEFSLK